MSDELATQDTATGDGMGVDRRQALHWMGTVAVMLGAGGAPLAAFAQGVGTSTPGGYGKDPPLLAPRRPWPLTLTTAQRAAFAHAADAILPGDDTLAAPSTLGVADFFDEWLSAPYPDQVSDKTLLLPALQRLDAAAAKKGWPSAIAAGRVPGSNDRLAVVRLRGLVVGAIYTLPEGMKAIGYVGNQPMETFPGPPPEVLAKLEAAAKALPVLKKG